MVGRKKRKRPHQFAPRTWNLLLLEPLVQCKNSSWHRNRKDNQLRIILMPTLFNLRCNLINNLDLQVLMPWITNNKCHLVPTNLEPCDQVLTNLGQRGKTNGLLLRHINTRCSTPRVSQQESQLWASLSMTTRLLYGLLLALRQSPQSFPRSLLCYLPLTYIKKTQTAEEENAMFRNSLHIWQQ